MTQKWKSRLNLAKWIIIFFLLVFFLSFGVHGFLFFIPKSWGRIDEYGEYVTTRDALTSTISVMLAFGIFHFANKYIGKYKALKSAVISIYVRGFKVPDKQINRYEEGIESADIPLALIAERLPYYNPSFAHMVSRNIIDKVKEEYIWIYEDMKKLSEIWDVELYKLIDVPKSIKYYIKLNAIDIYCKHKFNNTLLKVAKYDSDPDGVDEFIKHVFNIFFKHEGKEPPFGESTSIDYEELSKTLRESR